MKKRKILFWGLSLFAFFVGCTSAPVLQKKPTQSFSLIGSSQCNESLMFQDHRIGLRFCVPNKTKLLKLTSEQNVSERLGRGQAKDFEARLVLSDKDIEVFLRKDRLPPEMPIGALSNKWIYRYAEAYARRKGILKTHFKSQILHKKRSRFLHADAAVWAAFPLTDDKRFAWEEILVLAKKPSTRYLISIRLTAKERGGSHRDSLRSFYRLLLKDMRLGATLHSISKP